MMTFFPVTYDRYIFNHFKHFRQMSDHSDEGDTNELIIIDGSSSGEQLLPLDGIPEPQIGPQFRPFRVPGIISFTLFF